MKFTDSIDTLKGVGEKTKKLFHKLNVTTVGELVYLFPHRYLKYDDMVTVSEAKVGERVCIKARIQSNLKVSKIRKLSIITTTVKDETEILSVKWFNMPFLQKILYMGQVYYFVGTIQIKNGKKVLEQPEYYTLEQYESMRNTYQPVYPLVEGLSNKTVQKMVSQIKPMIETMKDYVPYEILRKYDLLPLNEALWLIHHPTSEEILAKAMKRLIFNEFFEFLIDLQGMKNSRVKMKNCFVIQPCEEERQLIEELPYQLTNSQKNTLVEIKQDMASSYAMNRLVQGDVGSGKTIVALLALLCVVKSGYQGALMVPTEVLAKQHYESFSKELERFGIRIALLLGSTKTKEKKNIYEQLKNHEIDILIGTHALIQEKVEFAHLGLVVTDEQHRFGVKQRERLFRKGQQPHVLVMSATPIPRTLGLILYGDLDISVMKDMPANRLPIKNCVVDTSYRNTAYKFIQGEVEKGHQCYVICPMVEENEALELESVTEYSEMLKQILPKEIEVAYLHGKMSQEEKQDIMDQFSKNQIQVLVSTTVIEVGINVPNATVMMVENAERFGLAQLHQLRGRVGRGNQQSYCIFIQGNQSKVATERLNVLKNSNDGFYIAEEDLKLRGPGDFFGIRQSGLLHFQLGDIYNHAEILSWANETVQTLKQENTDINQYKNPYLNTIDENLSYHI
ncbi:MAG: ATP-dependent DNA helicase RecG [Lachnospiraceae bacterium]|nr:ATP-dependent DNA helicase RecG [Lachnospiraceae bacterium]